MNVPSYLYPAFLQMHLNLTVQPRCTAIEILKNVLFFCFLLITPLFMPENFREDYTPSVFDRRAV